jgi:hypothetical protein
MIRAAAITCAILLAVSCSSAPTSTPPDSGEDASTDLIDASVNETVAEVMPAELTTEIEADVTLEIELDVIAFPFGQPCSEHTDCLDGYCVETPGGKVCTGPCDLGCPDGWACQQISIDITEMADVCLPADYRLCVACSDNDGCGGVLVDNPYKCILYPDGGAYCSESCDDDEDCPADYTCQESSSINGSEGSYCMTPNQVCICTEHLHDIGITGACWKVNDIGACAGENTCDETLEYACTGEEPAEETCDKTDNDCNGIVDDEIPTKPCEITNDIGTCTGEESCVDGIWECDALEPIAEVCDAKDNDCNGEADDGLEPGVCQNDNEWGLCTGEEICTDGALSCTAAEPAEDLCDGLDNNCDGITDNDYTDTDEDSYADCIDEDDDNDDILDPDDNCKLIPNFDQTDIDDDSLGDACDSDRDGDTIENELDNCPDTPNTLQENNDLDDPGDICDLDDDNDNDPDQTDCAPFDDSVYNGATEICDEKDNNCDGVVNEMGAQDCFNYFYDNDKDTWYVDGSDSKCLCAPDEDNKYTGLEPGDCDDDSSFKNPGATDMKGNGNDENCDGADGVDTDGDGFANTDSGGDDCDDNNDQIYPGQVDAVEGFCAELQWTSQTLDDEGNLSEHLDMAVDDLGFIHIAYYDWEAQHLRYMTNITGDWTKEIVDATADCGKFPSIFVDGDGFVHISYKNDSADDLKYASNAPNSIFTNTTAVGEGYHGHHTSIVLDSDGAVHIGSQDTYMGRPFYTTDRSGEWVGRLVSGQGGEPMSLAIDGNDVVHMAFYVEQWEDLHYGNNADGEFRPYGLAWDGKVGTHVDIATGPNNNAHLVYFDHQTDALMYKHNVDGVWLTEVVVQEGVELVDLSLVIDSAGHAHIAFKHAPWWDLRYATNSSGVWRIVTADWEGDVGEGARIGLAPDGTVHIVHRNAGDGTLELSTLTGCNVLGTEGDTNCDGVDGIDGDADGVASVNSGGTDCDDGNINRYPGASDTTGDDFDADCDGHDGVDADGDTFASEESGGTDCDDSNVIFHPPALDAIEGNCQQTNWKVQLVDHEGDTGTYTSIGIGDDGATHIAYHNNSDQDLRYATNGNGQWETSILDTSWKATGLYTDLALDSTGAVHITYHHQSVDDLNYITNTSGDWQITAVATDGYHGMHTALALDDDDNAHVAFYDDYLGRLWYASNDSGEWWYRGIDVYSDCGYYNTIAIDKEGNRHIAYYCDAGYDLKYANDKEGEFKPAWLDWDGKLGEYASMALDDDGDVHIAYHDAQADALKYATNKSGYWIYETIDWKTDWGTPTGEWTSMGVDSAEAIHIAMHGHDNLRYMTNKSGIWATSNVDWGVDVGTHTDMAIDDNDVVHISYRDEWNGNLKYAHSYCATIGALDDTNCDGVDGVDGDKDGDLSMGSGGTDCNDGDNAIFAAAPDTVGDGVDQNCDGNDGVDEDGDKFASIDSGGNDCNDTNRDQRPGVFDGVDGTCQKYDWQFETLDHPGLVGKHSDLILDLYGNAHIAYWDASEKAVKYMTNKSGDWVAETIDTSWKENGMHPSIVIGKTGIINVFYNHDGHNALRRAIRSDNGWTVDDVPTHGNISHQVSAGVDAQGGVHVAYHRHYMGRLYYANNSNGLWTSPDDGVIHGWGTAGEYNDLAIGPLGGVHVCYFVDETDELWYLNGPGGWSATMLDSDGKVGKHCSIALDSNNKVHISYYDDTNDNLRYITNLSGDWVKTTLQENNDVGAYTAIAVDDNDAIHISYYGEEALRYSSNKKGLWQHDWLDWGANTGQFTAMDVADDGTVFISYFDDFNQNLKLTTGACGLVATDTDQNCDNLDGVDSDADGHASLASGGSDCNDNAEAINPNAPETCGDNLDNNCNGQVDEGC